MLLKLVRHMLPVCCACRCDVTASVSAANMRWHYFPVMLSGAVFVLTWQAESTVVRVACWDCVVRRLTSCSCTALQRPVLYVYDHSTYLHVACMLTCSSSGAQTSTCYSHSPSENPSDQASVLSVAMALCDILKQFREYCGLFTRHDAVWQILDGSWEGFGQL